ncbi:MAG: response regulator transcription factor [Bacteroidales bacterium]|nr:response regulator transcription factor [Bacteroidales bacterium]
MKSSPIHIVLADSSSVVMHGLKALLVGSDNQFEIYFADSLVSVEHLLLRHSIDIVIINTVQVANIEKQFLHIKNEYSTVKWIALVTSWIDDTLVSMFDSRVLLNDSSDAILSVVQSTLAEDRVESVSSRQPLSERELDVLRLLVLGLSNKEIADKLFISTYTVISHRKNISQKTGIKSVSGLTIYAVVKGIISLPQDVE